MEYTAEQQAWLIYVWRASVERDIEEARKREDAKRQEMAKQESYDYEYDD